MILGNRLFAFLLACGLAVVGVAALDSNGLGQDRTGLTLRALPDPPFVCGTGLVEAIRAGRVFATPLASGEGVHYLQDPPILRPTTTGRITLRDFTIVGNHRRVRFTRSDGKRETWRRTRTSTISGRVVSIFNPSWPASVLAQVLISERHGFDFPNVFWGEVTRPGAANLFLRISSTNIPTSRVTKINSTVQYASHVVNLVIPNFGDSVVAGGEGNFDLPGAATEFFKHFKDAYDGIAFVPQASPIVQFAAFHRNVRNQVRGIGLSVFNNSATYGSNGTLKGVEVYRDGFLGWPEASFHEIAHQWGDYLDWDTMGGDHAGRAPAGGAHAVVLHAHHACHRLERCCRRRDQ